MRYLDEYLAHLENARGVSPHTLRGYRADLERFASHLDEEERRHPEGLGPTDLKSHVAGLLEAGLDRTSVARHASALRGFFRWMIGRGYAQKDPTTRLRVPREGRTLPRVLSQSEVERLLEAPGGTSFADSRDRALLETLYSAGLRVSELVGIDLEEIDLDEGLARVRGKGDRERLGLLGSHAVAALQAWLEARALVVRDPEERALFVNRRGGRLTDRSVRRLLEKRLVEAGLPASVTPHTLRHTFATHMLESGAGLKEVQELLGHKQLSTTQVYTHVSPEHLRRAYERAHPLVDRRCTARREEGAAGAG